MKELLSSIMTALKQDERTLQEVADATGINKTRVFRMRSKHKSPDIEELIKLAELYSITPASAAPTEADIEAIRKAERAKAWDEIWEKAEIKIATKYNMTPEKMMWKLTAPQQVG